MTRIEQSIEVNAPATAVYNQLTQFEDYPKFMEDVEEVRQLDDTHLHWRAKLNNHDMEWDAEIMEQVPDQFIVWRNMGGPVKVEKVEVHPLEQNKAKVTMTSEYEEPQQTQTQESDADVKIAEHAVHDLMRFKKFIESRGKETGQWRGEVHQGKQVKPSQGEEQQAGTVQRGEQQAGQQAIAQPSAGQAGAPQPQAEQGAEQDPMLAAMSTMSPQSWLPNVLHAWEEPFVMMRKMTEDMDQLFERFLGRPMYGAKPKQAAFPSGATAWSPPMEVAQRDNQLVILADLPGVKQEDVHVEIKNDRLVIEGDRREDQRQAAQGFRQTERPYGHFYRVIALPEGINADEAAASMRDGVLEVTVPVQQTRAQGRKLDIRAAR